MKIAMLLPPKVEAAVNVLGQFDIRSHVVAPFAYRAYLRLRPETPPPLWGANAGYWTFLAFAVALGCAALFFCLAAYWLYQQGRSPIVELLSPAPQIVLWTFFGFFGWLTAWATSDQMKSDGRHLQLPAWPNFTPAWRPAIDQVEVRANPNRFWLAALRGEAIVKRAEVVGVVAFVALATVLPVKSASVAEVIALVYFILCIIAYQRGPRGLTLAAAGRARNAWFIQHGMFIGFLSAALFWNYVLAVYLWPTKTSSMLGVNCLIAFLMHYFDRARFAQQRLLLSRIEKAEHERQLAEVRLHTLKAQIEPHFIFNTIAHLKSMIATDPKLAERMADELSDFLRASLAVLRKDWSTVGEELKLARAYLEIAKLRMGSRLSSDLRIGEGAADVKIPPLLIQTLLENAIQHGVEPSAAACDIYVSANIVTREDQSQFMLIRVVDTGVGFGEGNTGGAGVGLANVRERLASAYAGRAKLAMMPNTPSGVVAEIELPLEAVI
jgi:hypothetical protein